MSSFVIAATNAASMPSIAASARAVGSFIGQS
jgi:hypothetical protein